MTTKIGAELDKSAIPTSPPRLTPIVLRAIHALVGIDRDDSAKLLLLDQDVDLEKGRDHYHALYRHINPRGPDYNAFQAKLEDALKDINNRFLYQEPELEFGDGPDLEAEFRDVKWCQDYLDALSNMGLGYMVAVDEFMNALENYGRPDSGGPPPVEMPNWEETHGWTTLDELDVIRVLGTLLEKPQWGTKVENSKIVAKWKAEALAQGINAEVFDFVIQDLRWLRATRDRRTGSILTHIPCVYTMDLPVNHEDTLALKEIVASLEDVPENLKDWHPGSNGQVLDLVHPSLYPYVRGRTRRYVPMDFGPDLVPGEASDIEQRSLAILKQCSPPVRHTYPSPEAALDSIGEGRLTSDQSPVKDTVEVRWPREREYSGSAKCVYQWLPTDVNISSPNPESDGIHSAFPVTRFLSYINNLHPDPSASTRKLYPVLERVLARFVPLFERVLSNSDWKRPSAAMRRNNRIGSGDINNDPEGTKDKHEEKRCEREDEDTNEGEDGCVGGDSEARGFDEARDPPPDPIAAEAKDEDQGGEALSRFKFKAHDQLQIVVKLANIHLTPEKPDYPGGSWHVEGTNTERIVATGIYYYDSENITTSKLSFRVAISSSLGISPSGRVDDELKHIGRVYGISQWDEANQVLGSINAEQGRCIAFPNNMQHRVEPFSLADRSKSGHRKILVFFLINPYERVLSTSDVPPQQFEWYVSEIRKGHTRLSGLPTEIFDEIIGYARAEAKEEGYPWPMPWEEALKHREQLMEERGRFVSHTNGQVFERDFSLCEH